MPQQIVKPIIILSGPIGAGKSTVARELVALLPSPVACIEGDTFWSFIAKDNVRQPRLKSFKTLMLSMTAAAVPYALSGYDVILDFSIPPWFIDTALKIVKRREIPLEYVVLKPSKEVCAQRAADRAEGKINDYSEYLDLYESFSEAESNTIQDDTSDASSIASHIFEEMKTGRFRMSD